jgi:hypothetical protein
MNPKDIGAPGGGKCPGNIPGGFTLPGKPARRMKEKKEKKTLRSTINHISLPLPLPPSLSFASVRSFFVRVSGGLFNILMLCDDA